MTGKDLIALTHRKPFRPFVIETVSGETYKVRHPDFVAAFGTDSRKGATAVIVAQDGGPDVLLNTMAIDRVVLLSSQEDLLKWS